MKTTNLLFILFLFLTACHKDIPREEELPVITNETLDLAYTENEANELLEALDNQVDLISATADPTEAAGLKVAPVCPVISFEFSGETLFPHTVVVNFGDGCKGKRTHDISGKLLITRSAQWSQQGSERVVTIDNMTIDDLVINGTR